MQKISSFQYFGHGTKFGLMIQYNKETLYPNDLMNIKQGVFMKDATSKSWGCNTGIGKDNSFAQTWSDRFNHPMKALIGRSDYSPVATTRNPLKKILNWYFFDNLPKEGFQYDNKTPSEWKTFNPQSN